MVAISSEVSLPSEPRLIPGELPPVNDQAMLHATTSATIVADFDLEVEEKAFYRQNEERVWCSLGAWDM